MRLLSLILILILTLFQMSVAGKTKKPFTVRTQINVRDPGPTETKFIRLSTAKDGKPIGIIVKRRKRTSKSNNRKPKEISEEISEEVQEIIGVRVPDSKDDFRYVYRNAKIVNNKLISRKNFRFQEGE